MPTAVTVVPNWNGADFLADCLHSLRAQGLPPSVRHVVVVVDNGSVDASRELLARDFADVEVVALPHNLGFAGGVNRGIARAAELGADFVALLNNDARADPGWLAALLAAAGADPAAAVVAAKSVRAGDRMPPLLDTTGDCYTVYGIPYPRGRDEPDDGRYDAAYRRAVFAASGGACLWRAAALARVGVFAEEFFAYYEDVDLSFRARLAGWTVRYEPTARVTHAVNRTSAGLGDFVRFHSFKNTLLLALRCLPGPLLLRHLPTLLAGVVWQLGSDTLRGRLPTDLRALVAVVRLLPSTLRARRAIQRSRVLSPATVDALLDHHWPATMVSPGQRLRRLARRPR